MAKDRKRDRKEEVSQLEMNEVQATSVMEVTHIDTGATGDSTSRLCVAAVLTHAVRFNDMWTDALENNEGDINKAVKKFAAAYYTSLSPTTLSDIKSKLQKIVNNSLTMFALICSAWKYQNCNQFEDEDGFDLSKMLNNVLLTNDMLQETDISKTCDFSISNSDWKKLVLKHLKGIYLSKLAKEFIYTYFGHFIDLDPAFEGTQRLYTIVPLELVKQQTSTQYPSDKGKDKDTFTGYLATLASEIDDSYNAYPFMDGLLEYLGLSSPDREYDFTRDLAQMKLNLIKDSDELTADMIYMINSASNFLDVTAESSGDIYNFVKVNKFDGSYFTAYKDKEAAADSLRYYNRVVTKIDSIVNALRGNVNAVNITFYRLLVPNAATGTRSKGTFAIPPYRVIGENASIPAQKYLYWQEVNQYYATLNFPTDGVYKAITAVNSNGVTTSYKLILTPSSGDFLISSDDIESVISDATYFLIFDKEVPAGEATVNTLGNNGSNSTNNTK